MTSRFDGHEFPQVLPVVDEVRVGPPAPWVRVSAGEREGMSLDLVRQRLIERGRTGDHGLTPDLPPEVHAVARRRGREITRRAGVLVALFEEAGETHVILTRRSFALRTHSGEVSFPGGRSNDGESPAAAALREAHEEIGLDPSLTTLTGILTPIATFASGSAIWPVVAELPGRPLLTPDPREVDRVFTVALKDLLAEGAFHSEQWRREEPRPGSDEAGFFTIYMYRVPGDLIWGATARILTELLCVVSGVEWPDEARTWS